MSLSFSGSHRVARRKVEERLRRHLALMHHILNRADGTITRDEASNIAFRLVMTTNRRKKIWGAT